MRFLLACLLFLPSVAAAQSSGVLTAGFVCTGGVYGTELTAPWDVLQRSVARDDQNYVQTVLITQDGAAVRTAEGLSIAADFSFENAPRLDIVVIPGSTGSMGADLQNRKYIDWLKQRCEQASWVVSLRDGAFALAATGLLDDKVATTFPGDRAAFTSKFPKIEVRSDVRFVVDGKFVTSTGGASSFEPAFWLMERLYGPAHVAVTGQGLAYLWNAGSVPHFIVLREN